MDNNLKSVTKKFTEELMKTEAFKDYYQKKDIFRADSLSQDMMFKFNCLKADIMEKQQKGTLQQEDIQELRQAQQELQSLEKHQEMIAAENQAKMVVKEINKELTDRLGFNFGDYAKPPGGCC